MQEGETAQGSVALSSSTPSLTSVDAVDTRIIGISDTSSCSTLLTIEPTSVRVVVDGDAEVFNVTAPSGNCEHIITFSGSGVSTSSNTSDVNVITDQAVVTVGLYDSNGDETASVSQGGTLKVKFTPPTDWEGVTTTQSYTVSTSTSGISFSNNPCTLTPPATNVCQVTASIGESVTATNHSFSIAQGSSTAVPVDEDSLTFTVESGARFIQASGVGEEDCMIDTETNLMIPKSGELIAAPGQSWTNAENDPANQNTANLCGHSDWRQPTMLELTGSNPITEAVGTGIITGWNTESICGDGGDEVCDSPVSWLQAQGFGSFYTDPNVQPFGMYWSGTELVDLPSSAWAVCLAVSCDFTSFLPVVLEPGHAVNAGKGTQLGVLPVRQN
jgi:hypothetical protein